MYLKKMFGLRIKPLDQSIAVVAADPQEIDRFIDDLKRARDNNAHSGGGYAAFFHAKDGSVVQFDVQVPIKARREMGA